MMIRFLGFLTGSAAAIGAILLLLGVPEFRVQPQNTDVEQELEPVAELVHAAIAEAPPVMIEQPSAEPEQPVAPPDPKWHSFWSPFGSRIAANGFVSRLEALTGFDYRVVKTRTGVYDVAFAYADESERLDKLSVIASTAGLDLNDT